MHPHWAVRRITPEQLTTKCPKGAVFNMEQRMKEHSIVGVHGDKSRMYMVRVPFLTNRIDLQTGVELLSEIASKPKKERTPVDWKHDQILKERDEKLKTKRRKIDEAKGKVAAAMLIHEI